MKTKPKGNHLKNYMCIPLKRINIKSLFQLHINCKNKYLSMYLGYGNQFIYVYGYLFIWNMVINLFMFMVIYLYGIWLLIYLW